MKTRMIIASALASAAVAAAAQADNIHYSFTYTGSTASAYGWLEIIGGVATDGSCTVTNSAVMDGTYSFVGGAGNNGVFIWDNLVNVSGNPQLTSAGLLFTSGGNQINIWGNSPGNYSMWGWNGGYTPQDDNGVFETTKIPAPGALALIGVAGLVGSRRRRG